MTVNHEILLRKFESRTLDPATFHHNEHVCVAYELLRKNRFPDAVAVYAGSIDAMATKAGVPDKFNTTITFAFMSLIAERMAGTGPADFEDFISRNPDLLATNILETWYSPARLHSDLARATFLMPDRDGAPG